MMKMRRSGVIAKKIGMSAVFTKEGRRFPVTVLEVDCCVVGHRVYGGGGFQSVQIGAGKCKKVSKPLEGCFKKAKVYPRSIMREFRVDEGAVIPVGALLKADYFFKDQYVDVVGTSIGRGFSGVMKLHNFSGLRASHGVSASHRSPGSTGQRKDPGKVFKGKKMAGLMGGRRVTVQNLRVISIDTEMSLLVVSGAVPGYEGGWVLVSDAVKKPFDALIPEFSGDSLERVSVSAKGVRSKKEGVGSKTLLSSSVEGVAVDGTLEGEEK